jgi:V/A-type H+-transporting ATPase subunit A
MSETARKGIIKEINGPIVTVRLPGIRNGEQVAVGEIGVIGEVIALHGEDALVQAYESTE